MIEINKVIQSSLFAKQKKRLHKSQIKDLDKAVREITQNPEIGVMARCVLAYLAVRE